MSPARNLLKSLARRFAFLSLGLLIACVSKPQREVAPAPPGLERDKADRVLVLKAHHKLYLMRAETVLESFPVALGKRPTGPKVEAGDKRTPEGAYVLDWRNPDSQFYRSIHISYPNAADAARARAAGVSPGADVMIHGLPNGQGQIGGAHTATDWTDGCIAVTNAQMDVIWRMVDDNTPIEIRP